MFLIILYSFCFIIAHLCLVGFLDNDTILLSNDNAKLGLRNFTI